MAVKFTDLKFLVTVHPVDTTIVPYQLWADSVGEKSIEQVENASGVPIEKEVERREFVVRFENGQKISMKDKIEFQNKNFKIVGILDKTGDRRFLNISTVGESIP